MDVWKEYVLSIIICTLYCGILTGMVSGTARKKLMQLICGASLVVAVLYPVSGLDLYKYDFDEFLGDYRNAAQDYVSLGMDMAMEEKGRYIKNACAAYICNKAASQGAKVTAEVYLDDELLPVGAEISGHSGQQAEEKLICMLESDLGITRENQVWIWNRKDNSS